MTRTALRVERARIDRAARPVSVGTLGRASPITTSATSLSARRRARGAVELNADTSRANSRSPSTVSVTVAAMSPPCRSQPLQLEALRAAVVVDAPVHELGATHLLAQLVDCPAQLRRQEVLELRRRVRLEHQVRRFWSCPPPASTARGSSRPPAESHRRGWTSATCGPRQG